MVVAVAALLGVAVTARLGFWQLDRAAQKTALQQSIESRRAMPPLDTAALARDEAGAAAQHYRPVVLEGRWLPQFTVYLDNRQMEGRPGFFVVTPLQLGDGSAVLVQRGWLPRDPLDRTRLAPVPTPAGTVSVSGRIAPAPSRLYEFAPSGAGRIRQNLDLAGFALETGLSLRPLSVLQLGASADGLRRDWPEPAVDVQMHYGYAFQWFALAALLAGLYVWFQLIDPWRRRRR